MTEIVSNPGYITGSVKLGTDSFSYHVSKASLVPTARNTVVKDITGVSYPIGGASDWALSLDVFGQPAAATSLTNYLRSNDGQTVAAEMTTGVGKFAFSVVIAAAAFGLDASNVATSTVSMPASAPVATFS